MASHSVGQDPPAEHVHALITLFNQQHYSEVVARTQALVRNFPASVFLWSMLGAGSARNGQPDLAVSAFGQACTINPGSPEAHYNLGMALKETGKLDAAAASYEQALALRPHYADAHNNLGNVLNALGKLDEAAAAYVRAVECKPDNAAAHGNLGAVRHAQGRLDEAVAAYARAVACRPDHAEAHHCLGAVLGAQGRLDEAAAAHARAVAINPDYAEAHNALGIVLKEQGMPVDAIAAFNRALACRPDYAEAHCNRGIVLQGQGKRTGAIAAFRRALASQPQFAEAEAQLLHQQQHVCDWQDHADLERAFARLAAHPAAPPPFAALSMVDDAAAQLQFSRKWAVKNFRQLVLPGFAQPRVRPQRLRIGYFSADFHDHATLFLMAGLLREHDKTRFEVYAYSYGSARPGDWGERARRSVDRFFDVAGQPSQAIVDLARSHRLDLAIDLKGHTAHARLDLFQHRLAPVQISYLGYPGSLGTDFIDYIVADPVVIPDDQRRHYSERVIFLPHSYQPNDQARPIAQTGISRADFGLPAAGMVFCCFNSSYKISPREFAIWMRVLGKVNGSVLWLLKSNRWCEANLRNEAAARGIPPERLIFADFADHPRHLARLKHADLFLDTFTYNAHTTASDALWAGLPVVTRIGRQFAARVSSSLLTAVGLPELITETDAAYEALILSLATDPARLAQVRTKLAASRQTAPLFDTVGYTRNFEAGLSQAFDLHVAGRAPQDIRVAPGRSTDRAMAC